ncbi:YciI family protein [soil metagenome]
MEKFLYLFRGGMAGEQAADVPQEHMMKWMQWMESLTEKGIMIGGEPLVPTGKQVNGSKKIVTDGPFIEAKELVGGYLVVNAKDINEAVEFSKDCPIFDVDGRVEVRPIQKMEL